MSGAAVAAAAAAAAAAERRKEEEIMTVYHDEDLEGWEFKIVRASTRRFKNPDVFQKLCAEEAEAGWQMIEKFDDNRIRFKRRVEKRSLDQHLHIDPYRTHVGITEGGIAAIIISSIALVLLVVVIMKLIR